MYWAIIAILVALWVLGVISGVGGLFIHALFAVAAIMLFYKPLGGRRIMR
jgi:Family of unknown function (DUF5670)